MRFITVFHRVIVGMIFASFVVCVLVAPTRVPLISLVPVLALCGALVAFGMRLKRPARKILHLILCAGCFAATLALLSDVLIRDREFMDWADTLIIPAFLAVVTSFVSLLARAFIPEEGRDEKTA